MEHTANFVALLIIAAVAFAAPILGQRVLMVFPVAVIEILAGILLGDSGLGVIQATREVEFLALLGFAYLMFLSGLEVDFRTLGRTGREAAGGRAVRFLQNPLHLSFLLPALTLALSLGFAFYLSSAGHRVSPWFIALVLSAAALGVVVPTLKDRKLIDTHLGQTILLTAAVADFAAIFFLTVFAAVITDGLSFKAASVVLLVIGLLLTLRATATLQHVPLLRRLFDELAHAASQLQVRGSILLLLIFVAFAELLGAEVVLGAFVAGVVVSSLSREVGSDLRTKLDAIGYGFLIPFFFITVGASFNLSALQAAPGMVNTLALLVAGTYLVQLVPTAVLLLVFPWRLALGGGVLLSARLSLVLAAAAIGQSLGIIGEATGSAIILLAVITSSTAPALFNLLVPAPREAAPRAEVAPAEAGQTETD